MVEALHPIPISELSPKKEPERKGKLAWVLSPGFFNGWLQMGAMERLDEMGLSPDLVVGSSIGTYVGIIPATRSTKEQVRHMAQDYDIRVAKEKGFMNRGFFSSRIGMELVRKNFPNYENIEDLPVPFYIVVTRLSDYKSIVLSQGPLLPAMEAGVAHPLFFPPVKIGGEYYLDGGITKPAPIDIARQNGATHVIFIDAQTIAIKRSPKPVEELPKPTKLLLDILPNSDGWINPFTVGKAPFIRKTMFEELMLMSLAQLNTMIGDAVELHKPDIYINFSERLNGERVPISKDAAHPKNGVKYMELGRIAVDMHAEELLELKKKLEGQDSPILPRTSTIVSSASF